MNEWWFLFFFMALSLLALPIMLFPLRHSRRCCFFALPLLMAFAVLGYGWFGSWKDWLNYLHQNAQRQKIEAVLQTIKSPDELIERMKARLVLEPNSAKGWYLLGRLYASRSQWLDAREAFFRAYQLNSDDELATVNYIQSLWQLNQQEVNQQIRALCQALLVKNPNQPDAITMLAMDAYRNRNYQQAISHWEHLLKLAPAQSEEAYLIRKAIAKAQKY